MSKRAMAEADYSLLKEVIATERNTDDKSSATCYAKHCACCSDDACSGNLVGPASSRGSSAFCDCRMRHAFATAEWTRSIRSIPQAVSASWMPRHRECSM